MLIVKYIFLSLVQGLPIGFGSRAVQGDSFHMVPLLQDDNWELPVGGVVIETKLGHGAFGDVYQGMVKEFEATDGGDLTGVAIKVMKGEVVPVV